MLDKLDRLGFRGIIRDLLFDSYLSDRRMYLEVNGCKSETKKLNIGLPQIVMQFEKKNICCFFEQKQKKLGLQ